MRRIIYLKEETERLQIRLRNIRQKYEFGKAVLDEDKILRFVTLDRFCTVHEDGSIFIPSEITTYWQLVILGEIEQEFNGVING